MAANRFMPAIWSPCAGSEKAGGPPSWVSASSRPERAKNAVESKPGCSASGPLSP